MTRQVADVTASLPAPRPIPERSPVGVPSARCWLNGIDSTMARWWAS